MGPEGHPAADLVRAKLAGDPQIIELEDTRTSPGIEWNFTVDRVAAGRYGVDVLISDSVPDVELPVRLLGSHTLQELAAGEPLGEFGNGEIFTSHSSAPWAKLPS